MSTKQLGLTAPNSWKIAVGPRISIVLALSNPKTSTMLTDTLDGDCILSRGRSLVPKPDKPDTYAWARV